MSPQQLFNTQFSLMWVWAKPKWLWCCDKLYPSHAFNFAWEWSCSWSVLMLLHSMYMIVLHVVCDYSVLYLGNILSYLYIMCTTLYIRVWLHIHHQSFVECVILVVKFRWRRVKACVHTTYTKYWLIPFTSFICDDVVKVDVTFQQIYYYNYTEDL